uniref:DDE Tnp4 domain-containing protein n=1 Tax=Amphimedon queenslandica TaxID=400682 RepID=A0A1X7UN39_AMPQE
MRKETFMYLCKELDKEVRKKDTHLRCAITVELRVAIIIWFLSTGTPYRVLAHLFGVSRSSICLIIRQVCTAIVKVLMRKYIKYPSGSALISVIDGFKAKCGFPNCGGAIDGSHIPISSPVEFHSDYYNRKGWYPMIIQAVADHNDRFLNIYIGWPGSVHDAHVFVNSPIYNKGMDGNLFNGLTRNVCNTNLPITLLGDSAYPLLPCLTKPFPHNCFLTLEQQQYNYNLSKACIVIENAFGRLKFRWRCLMKRLDLKPENSVSIISASCILHNVCEVHGDDLTPLG